jgi:hypothetical protein
MSQILPQKSILSRKPDGHGFYYGWLGWRQVNVRYEERIAGDGDDIERDAGWFAYVSGEEIAKCPTKDEAEAAAIHWAKQNPEEE